MGFGKAISLDGGTDGWRNAGLPIERDDTSTRA
jgi:rhodanese-related sulfurtransferase